MQMKMVCPRRQNFILNMLKERGWGGGSKQKASLEDLVLKCSIDFILYFKFF